MSLFIIFCIKANRTISPINLIFKIVKQTRELKRLRLVKFTFVQLSQYDLNAYVGNNGCTVYIDWWHAEHFHGKEKSEDFWFKYTNIICCIYWSTQFNFLLIDAEMHSLEKDYTKQTEKRGTYNTERQLITVIKRLWRWKFFCCKQQIQPCQEI